MPYSQIPLSIQINYKCWVVIKMLGRDASLSFFLNKNANISALVFIGVSL